MRVINNRGRIKLTDKTIKVYRVWLKKMTQQQKCAYSVAPENFCAKFCILVRQGPVHQCAVFLGNYFTYTKLT